MLAVSLKWRLGVVRRRPKGTKQDGGSGWTPLPARGLGGWTWVWMEGQAEEPRDTSRLGLSSLPCLPDSLFWRFLGFSSVLSLFLNLCVLLVCLCPSRPLLLPSPSLHL